MKHLFALVLVGVLASSASAGFAPTFDGILGEWTGPDVASLGTQPGPDGGTYELLVGFGDFDLFFGMARDDTDRYLGDTGWDNDSFFIAVDTDGVPGSGGGFGSYGRVDFGGTMLPDRIYNYAGGSGWYELATWNGGGWDYGWSDAGTYYGWQEGNADDELAMPFADIGGDANVTIWGWMTREGNANVEASWPAGYTGDHPTFGEGILLPEPATIALLGFGGLVLLRRRR